MMRIFSTVLVVCFLPGCAAPILMGMGIGVGADTLSRTTDPRSTETKISKDQLARLKPGMTKQEVRELLRKSPTTVITKGDGGSTAMYNYNAVNRPQGITTMFTKYERESQTVMVEFDSESRYVTHTLTQTRECGDVRGYSADNCEDRTGAK